MKVGIIMPLADQRGGAELALLHLLRHWRNADAEWIVIFLEDGPMVAEVQSFGLEAYVVPAGRLRQAHRFISTVYQISTIAKQCKLDVLLGWMAKAHLYGSFAAKLSGIPALWYQHGVPSGTSWEDNIATRLPAQGIFACSKTAIEAQNKLLPIRPNRIVYPCVDLEKFDALTLETPDQLKAKLNLPAHCRVIGIVGRLQRWKGMHVVIEAMPQILQQHSDVHCVIVGGEHSLEADYLPAVEAQIQTLGVAKQVTITGFQTNIPEWMQAIDIMVHASDNEPFGLVIIEAMALGKPLVASASGGPTEIVTPEVDGLLTPFGDSQALANAIGRYFEDPDLAQRLGKAAQVRAQDFSAQNYVRRCVTAIQEVLPEIM
jgi:glycosyltransferase involved in cell wall biosynthesis